MEHVIPDIPASHVLPLFYPSYLFLKQWLVVKFKIYIYYDFSPCVLRLQESEQMNDGPAPLPTGVTICC